MKILKLTFLLFLILYFEVAYGASIDRATLRWVREKPTINEIVINGNQYFSDGEIKKIMYSKVRSGWAAIKGDRRTRVQREALGRDTLEIKFIYLINGFLGIRVNEEFEMIKEDDTISPARVVVNIDEGRQFTYGEKIIDGDFPVRFKEEFVKRANKLKTGKPIDFFKIRQTTYDLKTILANNGYPYADVVPYIDTIAASTITPIRFSIFSDSLVKIGEILIEGSDKYPEYAALRELKIKQGNTYKRNDIVESERRLFESGYFSTLQLRQAAVQTNKYIPDFVLQVRERKTKYVTVTTGAGQSEFADLSWDLSAGLGKRNMFGSRQIDLLGSVVYGVGSDSRIIENLIRIRYTEPWFLGIRMPLSLSFTYEPEVKHPVQDFRVKQWKATISTTKNLGPRTKAYGGLEYQQVDIRGVPEELVGEVRKETEGLSIRRRLYLTMNRDSRDNIFNPKNGSVRELSLDYFGGFLGGDDNFIKVESYISTYHIVWPGWTYAARLKGGWVNAFDGSNLVPSKDRLFLGGANTIRGFRENSIAPLQEDSLPGAGFTAVFNQEFRWKTIQIFNWIPGVKELFKNLPIWQSLFFDMGNGYRDIKKFRFDELVYSYGTGIQIRSPAGPIRLDYARRIQTKTIPLDDRWHFTILYAF